MNEIDIARHKLIDAGLILEHQGHGDMTRGHVSIRMPGAPGHFLMKAHSIGLDEITPQNILTFDLEGDLVAGTARPHSERYIHSEIYRARPDVNAILHSHPTHTVAFSALGQPMRALSQGGSVFKDALPVYTDTIDLIRTQAQGRGLAMALGPHHAVLLRSHGVAMTGDCIEQAVVLAIMLEEAAQVHLLATASGAETWDFPDDDVARLRQKLTSPEQFVVNFDYLARKARRAYGR